MAKVEIKFIDKHIDNDWIGVFEERGSSIFIHGEYDYVTFEMELDKSTAIKFAKALRTEINKIEGI